MLEAVFLATLNGKTVAIHDLYKLHGVRLLLSQNHPSQYRVLDIDLN